MFIKLFKRYYFCAFALWIFMSCSVPKHTPDAYQLMVNHQTIAIIPPTVLINSNKVLETEEYEGQIKIASLKIQDLIYYNFSEYKSRGQIAVNIQNPATTNAILSNLNTSEVALEPQEICRLLQVDAIVESRYVLTRRMSDAAAFTISIIFGVYTTTNRVAADFLVHDGATNKNIWNYKTQFSAGTGSDPFIMSNTLAREFVKKTPYYYKRGKLNK